MDETKTLTAAEASKRLGITPREVSDLCRRGELPAIPQWRIREDDLNAYAAKEGK